LHPNKTEMQAIFLQGLKKPVVLQALAKRSLTSASNSSNNNKQEHIVASSRTKYNKAPPIDLKSVRTRQQAEGEHSKNTQYKTNGLALLSIPLVTFALGAWQVKRRERKMEMIAFMEARTQGEPRDLPTDTESLSTLVADHEYEPFRVKGHFLHSKETLLTVRSDSTGNNHLPGGYVITPFVINNKNTSNKEEEKKIILVNRGYVPYTHYSPTQRLHAQVEHEVELVGLLRGEEITNTFTPVNKPPAEWHHRDLKQMAEALGTLPIFIDARVESTISGKGSPQGGQTNVQLRNDHMSYIITWFTLSVLTTALWWKRYAKIFVKK